MKEVFGAVLATSLVLMAVFVPVSFMSGITGQMFRQFALCIASSIGLSTLVALTLAPALCAMILKSGEEKADFEFIQKFDNWFNSIRDKYLEGVKIFINSPKLTISLLFRKAFCQPRIKVQYLHKSNCPTVLQPPEQKWLQQKLKTEFLI